MKKTAMHLILIGAVASLLVVFQNCGARYDLNDDGGSDPGVGGSEVPVPTPTGFWKFDAEFGACSVPCGGGTQARNVWCESASGERIDDIYCQGRDVPAAVRACNQQACNATYYYVPSAWSSCVNNQQTRNLTCYDGLSSAPTAMENCASLPAPPTQQNCTENRYVSQFYTRVGPDNQIDLFLVIDDSSSMDQDQAQLASKMSGFITKLTESNLDWQMCYTSTDFDYFNGSPLMFTNNQPMVNRQTANVAQVISASILGVGSGYGNNEQAIAQTYAAIGQRSQHPCFRQNAAMSVIVLSDEDEASVGGIESLSRFQYEPLRADNQPVNLLLQVRQSFGANKRFSWHSIIVPPGPGGQECLQTQNQQGSPAFAGRLYEQLSLITSGEVTSICAPDYSANLNTFLDSIIRQTTQLELECDPVGGQVEVVTVPAVPELNTTLTGRMLSFNPALPINTQVRLSYQCQR